MSARPAPVAGVGAILAATLAAELGCEVTGLLTLEYPGLFVLVFFVAGAIASLHAACIAAPSYLFLIRRWPLRWWNSALAGLLIGVIPVTLLFAATGGWTEIASAAAFNGACGLVGGLTFRALRGRDPRDVAA